MVPGNLPRQLEISSTGQNYFQPHFTMLTLMNSIEIARSFMIYSANARADNTQTWNGTTNPYSTLSQTAKYNSFPAILGAALRNRTTTEQSFLTLPLLQSCCRVVSTERCSCPTASSVYRLEPYILHSQACPLFGLSPKT